ncbi:alpha-ketoacid dehydrogenase subunit beta [Ohessyouella blattaphilus]|uniref:Alpha-ketoacid dehydrogenase subunit beta n=1 Tax=Ohessyouella blattaphilus TaxID=2949333 RepID=A0ABT1EE01_9FIRM|nr:alpha-ketoacid dehydrogenase subunit beta [Ohessyouella blattaphilus]MCP1108930.1 alpha-ketoacid dehydrogenase subunit beta [Ohessyouella blattaphilus]MCR8562324.1 alpha-ketoacid dehydrogenase subunit beta [Ohessyouella blattaphilus]MDL2249019.1 alpha-ketoacid dehydrogenase subunit beta [Lachnospiraceae bacterium OttesenSCG-928-J05]
MAELSIADALKQAIREEMRRDEAVFCLGEDVDIEGGMGGAFTVTKGLAEEFGNERILNTPIAEILIGGVCVGAGITGMRPVADLQYGDFLFCMMDQLVNQAAKMCYMSGGTVHVPMVLRAPCGATNRGAQHAQSLESYFTHIPGLKVICPSTPYDAKGMLKQAIRDDNPVLVFEHKLLYGGSRKEKDAMKVAGEVPETDYTVEFGKAAVRREGTDVTIVANLLMSYRAQEAAVELEKEGISCEVIDPRSLVPFDYETVEQSVKKTGKLCIVHEDTYNNGWGAQVASHFAEHNIFDLDAPIKVVAAYDTPTPFAAPMENYVIPSTKRIIETVRELAKF